MAPSITNKTTLQVGTPTVLESQSPSQPYGSVFEDDGETGYFYALDFNRDGNPIVDALCVYGVAAFPGQDNQTSVEIAWSKDGLKSAVFVDRIMQAVFDFGARRGYCRTGFPSSIGNWSEFNHDWTDDALRLLD